MSMENNIRRPLLKFFLLTYLIFAVLFILTGIVIMLKAPKLIQNIMPIICAWSSSFAFIILFKKLYPDLTLKEFLKQQFCSIVKIRLLITVVAIHILILLAALSSFSIINGAPILSMLAASSNILVIGFFDNLIRGPLGEELGWRGYALNELQKRFSPLSSALIIGVVWGFFHAPLWFMTSGYSGGNLIKYIVLFMISIISISIIITAFYNLNKNLVIPILIHQLFNFSISLIKLDVLQSLYYIAPLYLLFAILLVVINPKKVLYGTGYKNTGAVI